MIRNCTFFASHIDRLAGSMVHLPSSYAGHAAGNMAAAVAAVVAADVSTWLLVVLNLAVLTLRAARYHSERKTFRNHTEDVVYNRKAVKDFTAIILSLPDIFD